MEVHHNPHVKKKNFKEYFFEFLMIFLAVTLGFFAEQMREYFADSERGKEYMQEIVQNLGYDTVRCSLNKQSNIIILRGSTAACGRPPPVFRVLRRPGRARTLEKGHWPRYASLRCAKVTFSSQALSDTPSAVSIARPPPHPADAGLKP